MPKIDYKLFSGERISGVTTILNGNIGWSKNQLVYWSWNLGMQGKDYRKISEEAMTAGSIAHSMIESDLKSNPFIMPEGDKDIIGKAESAFLKWLEWKDRVKFVLASSICCCSSGVRCSSARWRSSVPAGSPSDPSKASKTGRRTSSASENCRVRTAAMVSAEKTTATMLCAIDATGINSEKPTASRIANTLAALWSSWVLRFILHAPRAIGCPQIAASPRRHLDWAASPAGLGQRSARRPTRRSSPVVHREATPPGRPRPRAGRRRAANPPQEDRYITRRGEKDRFPRFSREALETLGLNVVATREPRPLLDGDALFLGEIPRTTPFEKGMPHAFFLDRGKETWDPIEDDSSIAMNLRGKGLIVLSGCALSGIINTVRRAMAVTGIGKVHAVMGGFHLSGPAFEPVIGPTAAELRKIGPDLVIPCHCTGRRAIIQLEQAMPGQFILNMSGTALTLRA